MKWTFDILRKESLKYATRGEFQKKNGAAYKASRKLKILNEICSHMMYVRIYWSVEDLHLEALKYKSRNEFRKNSESAYMISKMRNILDQVCSHMPKNLSFGKIPHNFKWSLENLQKESLKYSNRNDFFKKSSGAYDAASRLGILDNLCIHMKKSSNISHQENSLFNLVKRKFPNAKKHRDSKVNIEGKPYIKGFEIDIYIPELHKGIEFDGKYWHSFDKMRQDRRKSNWLDEDIRNYNNIKDNYFLSKGIELLHVNEKDWINDPEQCLKTVFSFLDSI